MAGYPPVSPYRAGLACKCPRCGQGALFKSYLALKDRCSACGLEYGKADAGDGPAVFVIFIVGFIAVALAFIARFVWFMSIGAAFALSASVAVAIILLMLRPLKATLIALEFANKAEEGRLKP